ncbi:MULTISPECIES: preprotein translocase subunit SecG [unclassified Aureispira]|uniref:preprotein translocase subunit SecG n=1 Tax=unclassified Aureispira TaxID=2649989 RepID=UPI0007C7677E|nr:MULTISPECIES: preprotein translocase subunit SecG [unclassified Aureispira]WMX17394.1 preprotein translocase subunit SecG [Aureispira sp. CCB-E]
MVLLLTILIAFISVLLILVILVQNPKGGGLSSAFGGSQAANQVMGAANSGDMLEKITWGLASSLLALCLVTGVFFKGDGASGPVGEEINTTTTTAPTAPTAPASVPGGQTLPQQPTN